MYIYKKNKKNKTETMLHKCNLAKLSKSLRLKEVMYKMKQKQDEYPTPQKYSCQIIGKIIL